jgi:hypothetical protein
MSHHQIETVALGSGMVYQTKRDRLEQVAKVASDIFQNSPNKIEQIKKALIVEADKWEKSRGTRGSVATRIY